MSAAEEIPPLRDGSERAQITRRARDPRRRRDDRDDDLMVPVFDGQTRMT